MLEERLQNELEQREQQHLYRYRKLISAKHDSHATIEGNKFLSFCTNDYLGLAEHPKVVKSAINAIERFGVGGAGSNLVSGHTELHQQLEDELTKLTGFQKVILFPSAYHANIAATSTLVKRSDVIFADKDIHASLIDGCILSRAHLKRYTHNDTDNLESLLQHYNAKNKWIITDGLFSTKGDTADLKKIIPLTEQYNANLILDDAHALGCLGKTGAGTLEYFDLPIKSNILLTGSFAKTFGTSGGFIAGNTTQIEHLIQFSRPYIYSNALPAAIVASTLTSLEIIKNEKWRREYLSDLIAYFQTQAAKLKLPVILTRNPIQSLLIGDSKHVMDITEKLKNQGILVSPMRPPTVKKNEDIIRISLTTHHTKKDIENLLNATHKIL